MISARPRILIQGTLLKHFALEVWVHIFLRQPIATLDFLRSGSGAVWSGHAFFFEQADKQTNARLIANTQFLYNDV